ncbi:MAG: hypothetical protein JKY51_10770 [Opitutaceae bacterium]|nr:hypothetical protein [Opitutaceae bacterium]
MKHQKPNSLLNRLLAITLLLLVFAGAIGFSTVWLRHQISVAANNNKMIEFRLADLQRKVSEVNAQVAVAVGMQSLLTQNANLDLGLMLPSENQGVRIYEDVEVRLARKRNQLLFSSTSRQMELPQP